MVSFQSLIGTGMCNGCECNTTECRDDCDEFNEQYPNCNINYPPLVGDGEEACNGCEKNTAESRWDGGDCDSP